MSKKNKHKSPHLAKQEQAHNKNVYLKRINKMMECLGASDAFNLLGQHEIDLLYSKRMRPIKIVNSAKGLKFAKCDLQLMNSSLNTYLKDTFVSLGHEKPEVSLYDFFTLAETIHLFWRTCKNIKFDYSFVFIEKLRIFRENYVEITSIAQKKFLDVLLPLTWFYADITKYLLWVEPRANTLSRHSADFPALFNNYILHIERPERLELEIDGKRRSIYRVGFTDVEPGLRWLDIKSKELGITGVLEELPLKIYIQTHAINRMKERLGSQFSSLEYLLIVNSLFAKDIYYSDDGGYLFSIKYQSIKLGYLKADAFGGMLLIRTFLFVTNNGTPEAKKLEKLIGLQKEDKKYLGIDRLEVFTSSDIEQNSKLKDLFVKAGCGGLFEFKNHLITKPDKIAIIAGNMSQYLGL